MEKNKKIIKLCYLQIAFYVVFLTSLLLHFKRGLDHRAFAPFIHLFRRNYFCGFSSNTNVPHLRLVYHNLTSKSKIFS